MLKHHFVEFRSNGVEHVEPVDSPNLDEAADRARELNAWRFRFFVRRWHANSGSGGWSDPCEHTPWTYVAGEVADPAIHDIPPQVLHELKHRTTQGNYTVLLLMPDGIWEFAPPRSTILFDT